MLVRTRNLSVCLGMGMSVLSICLSGLVFAADDVVSETAASKPQQLYAKVGNTIITVDEYNQSFQQTVRQRFYHSKPPEGGLEAVRKEVADELITRQLLLQEAARLGLKPDMAAIDNTLDQYDKQYSNSARWKQEGERLLKKLQNKLSEEDILRQLETRVRNVVPPTDAQLKKYYQQNPQKFTEPMQQKLSLILLVVDPSSSRETWDAALAKGQSLVKELNNGADFAELARTNSGDVSAESGGDMGYVHREMLSEAAQKVVDNLKTGEVSDAVRVLQGIAILRLDDLKPERLRAYNDVAERARALWLRDQSEAAWISMKEKLKLDTPVTVYNEILDKDNDV